MTEAFAVGVDLGATKIAAALVDRAGRVVATCQGVTRPADGPEAVLDRIAEHVKALIAQTPGSVAGIGIGSPGQVSPAEGAVRYATNLGWREVHVLDGLRARLPGQKSFWIDKDTNAGALGEQLFGAAVGCRDFVYLAVGSGLGAGAVTNGVLVTGAANNACELGHLSLDPNGRPCSCGLRGCAETVVSGPGLVAVTRQKLADGGRSRTLVDSESLTPATVMSAARSGDELALAAFGQVARWLGVVMATCAAVLNPAQIVLGGGLGLAAADLLLPGASAELQRRVPANSFQSVRLSPSSLTNSALGAACLVWIGLRQDAHFEKRSYEGNLTETVPS